MLVLSSRNLKLPISSVFSVAVAFHDQAARSGTGYSTDARVIRESLTFRVLDEAAAGPEVEIIKCRR